MSGENPRRHLAYLMGVDAERLALLLLIAKGYWPLARRYLAPSGEIDIIMKRGRTIVAVEVKARSTFEAAASSITPTKLRNISRALGHFRSKRQLDDSYIFRCDAVLLAPRSWPRHIVNVGEI